MADRTGWPFWARPISAPAAPGQYGLSARAIAVGTALPGPEEFPAFTDFWIEANGEDRLVIHAWSMALAVRGLHDRHHARRKGNGAGCGGHAVPAARHPRLGLAPITSMFDLMKASAPTGDWRPKCMTATGWRSSGRRAHLAPAGQSAGAARHMLRADGLKGFGMIQRDQAFDHYQDDQSYYDRALALGRTARLGRGRGDAV
jgi:glucans biosynthesis protein